jgi:hypothetical protein
MPKSFDDKAFYLHVDYGLGALPCSVVVVKLFHPLKPTVLKRGRGPNNEAILNHLHENGAFEFHHDYVYPDIINNCGHRRSCRAVVERAIPSLALRTKTLPSTIYSAPFTPISAKYPTQFVDVKAVTGLRIALLIAWYQRFSDAKRIWHNFHPQYRWNHNGGGMTYPHALACLEHGVIPYYHYFEGLKQIPQVWVNRIKSSRSYVLDSRDFSRHPPWWWTELFKDVPFFGFMEPKQRQIAEDVVANKYPTQFALGFLDAYKPNPLWKLTKS